MRKRITVATLANLLLLAAVLGVVAVGHCQAFADHTGLSDPCTSSLAVMPVSLLILISLHLFGDRVPALAGVYRLQPIEISPPPPER
jgi:hypothetical protein